jgi:hypothetical protein
VEDEKRDFAKMGKFIYGIALIGGAYLAIRLGGVYWAIAWIGICIAYGIAARKLHWQEALKLTALPIIAVVIMLGGGIILARSYGVAFALIWVILCIVLIIVFSKKIIKLFPTLLMAERFQEVVDVALEKEKEKGSKEGSNERD